MLPHSEIRMERLQNWGQWVSTYSSIQFTRVELKCILLHLDPNTGHNLNITGNPQLTVIWTRMSVAKRYGFTAWCHMTPSLSDSNPGSCCCYQIPHVLRWGPTLIQDMVSPSPSLVKLRDCLLLNYPHLPISSVQWWLLEDSVDNCLF